MSKFLPPLCHWRFLCVAVGGDLAVAVCVGLSVGIGVVFGGLRVVCTGETAPFDRYQ